MYVHTYFATDAIYIVVDTSRKNITMQNRDILFKTYTYISRCKSTTDTEITFWTADLINT